MHTRVENKLYVHNRMFSIKVFKTKVVGLATVVGTFHSLVLAILSSFEFLHPSLSEANVSVDRHGECHGVMMIAMVITSF